MKFLLRVGMLMWLGWSLLGTPQRVGANAGGWEILGQHIVMPGETLFCIGRAYGMDPWAIATQNSLVSSQMIHPGQLLLIPNVPKVLPLGPVCAPQLDPSPAPVSQAVPVDPPEVQAPTAPAAQAPTASAASAEFEAPQAPPVSPAPVQPAAPAPSATPCGGCVCQSRYVVTAGDTLTRISRIYDASIWAIADCNCIQNVNRIFIGDVLCIP